jgi:predicted permease
MDALRADAVFGWRQLKRRKITSAAAILSLGLGVGACVSAFRLIDALFLRPLPIAAPNRLYALSHRGIEFDGTLQTNDGWTYPLFEKLRAAAKDQADLIAVSYASHADLAYSSDQEIEKAYVQYVSGWMFRAFGLHAALGRLLTRADDLEPRAHAVAVVSFDYWTRRFGRDSKILGRTFRLGNGLYTIVGVAQQGFIGTEPGTMTDIFLPTMMNPNVERSDMYWFRTLALLKPGVSADPLRQKLQAVYRSYREEELKTVAGIPKQILRGIAGQKLLLASAACGISDMQDECREALLIFGVLVVLVLLIACANAANLLTAQAAARTREMALRVSMGAGRLRLMQLVFVESILLALFASCIGAAFAWWSAPLILSRINSPEHPARLLLTADWRVLGFGLVLILLVALLLGAIPALRASGAKPWSALHGGEAPRSRRRLMRALVAVQVAFCFLVLFVAGLFVMTLNRLSREPLGFSADRLLTLDIVTEREQPAISWEQVADHLRSLPGIAAAAVGDWPLLSENARGGYVSVEGGRPFKNPAFFLGVSPGWMNTMRIPFLAGRGFRPNDRSRNVAIVNEAFAKQFFGGKNVLNGAFTTMRSEQGITRFAIIGEVRSARYATVRGPMPPVAYFPFEPRNSGTFLVRAFGANPLALAPTLRREISRANPEFRVSNIRTQKEIDALQTQQERLLAMLALFFAAVAVLLAGLGLYGVLHYSVLQRRREIGIRMAVGARAANIGRLMAFDIFPMVLLGALAGVWLGMISTRYVQALLYQVKPTDLAALVIPSIALLAAAIIATAPALLRAVRIDPANVLRAE